MVKKFFFSKLSTGGVSRNALYKCTILTYLLTYLQARWFSLSPSLQCESAEGTSENVKKISASVCSCTIYFFVWCGPQLSNVSQ